MKKKLVTSGFFLLLLLVLTGTLYASAPTRLKAVRVKGDFSQSAPVETWAENTSTTDFAFGNLTLRLYTGYDQNRLYLGFYVKDPYLTFEDDFSLDFQGSDHLRISFWPTAANQVSLYLLPSSKIKEPLLNISGASWRQTSIAVQSIPVPQGYFLTVAFELSTLDLAPGQRELPLQIGLNEINSKGQARTHWLFGAGPQDYAVLVLSP